MLLLGNNVLVAVGNLVRHKTCVFLNIIGLALDLACCIRLMLWVKNDLSWERFHGNADRIYRVTRAGHVIVADELGPTLLADILTILAQIKYHSQALLCYHDPTTRQQAAKVDSFFLEISDLPLVKGSRNTWFDDRQSMLVTEETTARYLTWTPYCGSCTIPRFSSMP